VARIESGRIAYKFEKVFIEDIIARGVMRFKSRANEKNISLEVKSAADKDIAVFGDKIGLETVLENLISNAISYTLPGGRIDILYGKRDDEYIEVAVKDTGVGVPAGQRSRIFTKFFRGNNVVKMQTSGSGLGLFVAKSIINAHHGEIGVESEEGRGSTFWFRLPINQRSE